MKEKIYMKLDFTDLQNDVIDYWDEEGTTYFSIENNGFNEPGSFHYETTILPKFQNTLDDPMACIEELGFSSISQYIGSKT